jgi:hypothetical protein
VTTAVKKNQAARRNYPKELCRASIQSGPAPLSVVFDPLGGYGPAMSQPFELCRLAPQDVPCLRELNTLSVLHFDIPIRPG